MANEQLKAQNLQKVYKAAFQLFLDNGIENVTKEMISQESGLSRRSIDRYFIDKKDCVIKVAEWFLGNLRDKTSLDFPSSIFIDGKHTGAGIFRSYMFYLKKTFFEEPRIFILYSEFKMFVYRNFSENDQGYSLLIEFMGNRNLRQRIFELGKNDGSLSDEVNWINEEEYFCESFFAFLGNLGLSFTQHPIDELSARVDQRINNTLAIYTGEKDFSS
jgi:AcrR family transcriptional regulator